MNIITEVSMQKNKSRANIYLDGVFVCGMELSTILKHGIKVGKEITPDELKSLQRDSDIEKATEKALSLLDRQLYTKKQIKDKLKAKDYEGETIDEVVTKLENYGYISDLGFAKSFITSTKGKSKKELEYALLTKGIKSDVINEAFLDFELDDCDVAKTLAEKFMKYKEYTQENKTKLYAYLYRKGFNTESINYAINNCFNKDN